MKTFAHSIRRRSLLPVAGVLATLVATVVAGFYWHERQEMEEHLLRELASVDTFFHKELDDDTDLMAATLATLSRDRQLVDAMQRRDREALLQRARPLFDELKADFRITHLYFTDAERTNLLRVHRPEQWGDTIGRVTTLRAAETGRLSAGLEVGYFRALTTLRVVTPWFDNGELLGYIELGEEIHHITRKLKDVLGGDLLILVRKDLLVRDYWEAGMRMMGRTGQWDQLGELVVIDQTIENLPAGLVAYLDEDREVGTRDEFQLELDGQQNHGGIIPLLDASQRPIGGIVYFHDISPRVQGMRAMVGLVALSFFSLGGALFAFLYLHLGRVERSREQDQHLLRLQRTAQQATVASIVVTDHRRIVAYVNPAFEKISGYHWDEICGRSIDLLMGPGREDAVYRKAWQLAGRGRTWTGHLSHRKKDGRRYDVDATITPVREGEDPITNFVVVSLDVTREKQLAEQLRQSQKMDAIGQLAGGIAHDFNNLLTSILGYASLLKLKGELNPTTYQAVDVIETAANRAGDLTQQLLGFARRGKNQSVAVDLHGTIQEVIRLLSHTIDKGISITQRLESSAPVVIGDPNQLEQVLLNLCLNARDAIERRRAEEGPAAEGVISLITESVEAELDNAAGEDGGQVRIRITDTGCGIPREDLSRVFEPFFTTKEKGKGTGMGLAMAYGIIDNHEGSITVESTVGQGTAFTVLLPLARTARPSATREEMGAPIRGQGRLLVVDDEEIVLNTVQDLLLNLGYEVITAGSGEEAVKLYAENWRGIQLVLLDLVMPGMGGDECFSCLKEINPEVRAILSTGYGLNEQAQAVLDEGAVAFISKPYQINNLSSVIFEHLLDGRASH